MAMSMARCYRRATGASRVEQVSASLVDTTPRALGPFTVGPLGFGCWRLTTDSTTEARALIEAALEQGIWVHASNLNFDFCLDSCP